MLIPRGFASLSGDLLQSYGEEIVDPYDLNQRQRQIDQLISLR